MFNQILLTQGEDFFFQLFFGYGSPLLVLICAVFMIIVTLKVKESIAIFVPFSLIMGVITLQNATITAFNTPFFTLILWTMVLPMVLIGVFLNER